MSYVIRPFDPADWEATAQTGSTAYDIPMDLEQMRYDDEHRDPQEKHAWWSAEVDGQVVGGAGYFQNIGRYHPRKFALDGWVLPAHQGRGIGAALYETVMAALEPFEPISVKTQAREHMPRPIRFFTDRGFTEAMRSWQSQLDLTTFDPSPYADAEAALSRQGIRLASLTDLADDPDRNRRLYDLIKVTRQDIPSFDAITTSDFVTWQERVFTNPYLLPAGYYVAVQGDRYVGLTALWRRTDDETALETGFTGARRECRNQGIALALKVRALTWAKHQGYQSVDTNNATTNGPMLRINDRLGFQKQPAWIDYVKVLRPE